MTHFFQKLFFYSLRPVAHLFKILPLCCLRCLCLWVFEVVHHHPTPALLPSSCLSHTRATWASSPPVKGKPLPTQPLSTSNPLPKFAICGRILHDPFTICLSLLLALDSARFEFKLKMRLNRRMPERPNICYIFEKLRVQGCQIWHSHVPIPFNSAPAHSTRPHNAKKALYVIISGDIHEN